MSDEAADKLEESPEGYKKEILEVNTGSLEWEQDLIFNARTQMGMRTNSMPRSGGEAPPQKRCS